MSARRKDSKGRVLKEGEGYRKSDGLYTFRYKDIRGKIKAVYDSDLRNYVADMAKMNYIIEKSCPMYIEAADNNDDMEV